MGKKNKTTNASLGKNLIKQQKLKANSHRKEADYSRVNSIFDSFSTLLI